MWYCDGVAMAIGTDIGLRCCDGAVVVVLLGGQKGGVAKKMAMNLKRSLYRRGAKQVPLNHPEGSGLRSPITW
jgi:hypothetical protein